MKNFVSDGNVPMHLLTAAVSSGDVIIAGSKVGIAVTDGAIGEKIGLAMEGIFQIPAATGITFADGVKVGWDISAATAVASGDAASDGDIGVVTAAKGAGPLFVEVKLVQGLI